ncbi:MAG TPA: hypothetical protein VFX07_12815 [Candidatus Udaeobacter sp.]|nr:hypothetical protein [Candidatus Udaeobacter sp.]
MNPRIKGFRFGERGAALIIVLAFVVLFAGVGVAYLSRTLSDRQVANSSFSQATADQVAQSAMNNVVGDLRQEISFGSASPAPTFSANGSTLNLYVPCVGCTTPTPYPGWSCPNGTTTILPILPVVYPSPVPGTTPAIPNLIRRSVSNDLIPCPAKSSLASAVNSTVNASANGRSVTLARWNSHYLIPGGSNPITTGYAAPNYWAPDWVFVNDQGARVITAPDISVIGRYAYMLYDEGSLVDMNAAGYPSPTTILQYGRKGSLAFTDLTGIPPFPSFTAAIVDNIVGWRNYASAQASGTFPNLNLSNANSWNTYYNLVLSDPTNIQLTNYLTGAPLTYFTNAFLATSQAPAVNRQTDQAFAQRQTLIKFGSAVGAVDPLQYLGTFSRESFAKIPQWSPTTPDSINPNFQTLLVTGPFTRNDGTPAAVGENLVNRRFLLKRLNWLTYRGPSATRTIPAIAPALGDANYDMWLLTRGTQAADRDSIRFGQTSAFLQQGTDANILKYFGLVWDAANERWNYTGPSGAGLASSIATLGTLTATREPDFFELLNAGILNGSLGDSSSSYPELPTNQQQSTMLHILTIGANLIAQSRVDSYPVRIACSVGGTTMEAIGSPRLPYINSLTACPTGVTANSGGMNWFLIPNLWDPFRDTWDLTEANAGNTGNKPLSTPGYLRPPVRITIQGTGAGGSTSVGFGATSTLSGSGWVSPVTPLSTVTISASSQVLVTGDSTYGRDGFLQAMRMGGSDISGLTSFDPKTLGSTTPSWNRVTPPTNDNSTRTDNYAVFRLSANIPVGTTGYPVLIFNSGFQMTMDYQSPNGTWYPYSFLQGNNATTSWISSALNVATKYSQYGTPAGNTAPTIVNEGTTTTTRWDTASAGVAALAKAPMFAKGDPRSTRYSIQIGALTLAANSAGATGSLWPNAYTPTPPPMTTGTTPTPAPTPTPSGTPRPTPIPPVNGPNPATLGDNVGAGNTANPYNEVTGENWRPVMMNRPFRSVGEMAYAFRDQPFRTLSFSSADSPDAGLLDLFSVNDYTNASGTRGGVINLNSRQAPALAAVLTNTITQENTPRNNNGTTPSPVPLASPAANNVARSLTLSSISAPVVNRAGLATLIANETGLGPGVPKTQRESIARALGDVDQTRTWNLLLDVIAQSGRFPPNATSLTNGFVVNGEQRYWVHIAIDRFTGQVIDKQIEVVNE